jgi:CBS domain containing-hemolysin-like protein
LQLENTIPEILKELHRTRHTKVPIYQEHRDNIVGILYARDLLGIDLDKMSKEPQQFKNLLREPYFVPESKPAVELFDTFRERRMSCALTVDEYGGVTGLVTMEDLLECIFGEIHSPSDVSPQVYINMLDENRYRIDGAMPIGDLNREIGCDLPEDQAETIGGLVLHEFGELPPENTSIQINGLHFSVVDVEDNRIKELHLEKPEKPDASQAPHSDTGDEIGKPE